MFSITKTPMKIHKPTSRTVTIADGYSWCWGGLVVLTGGMEFVDKFRARHFWTESRGKRQRQIPETETREKRKEKRLCWGLDKGWTEAGQITQPFTKITQHLVSSKLVISKLVSTSYIILVCIKIRVLSLLTHLILIYIIISVIFYITFNDTKLTSDNCSLLMA